MSNNIDFLGHEFIDNYPDSFPQNPRLVTKDTWVHCKNCFLPFIYVKCGKLNFKSISCEIIKNYIKSHMITEINASLFNMKCNVCNIGFMHEEYFYYTCNEYLMIKANE